MAGGSGQQTTTTKSDPWSGQQPYLNDIFGTARSLYNSGAGGEYFPGSTVVPFSPDTQAGMGMVRNTAQQPAFGQSQAQGLVGQLMGGGQQNRNDVLNTAASGGFANPVVGQLGGPLPGTQQIAQGSQGPTPFVNDLVSAGQQRVTAGNPALEASASGQMLGANPYLDAMFNRASKGVTDVTNAQFSRGGRYGSGAHTGALADSLGGLAANIYGSNYEAERGRQLASAGELGNRQAGDIGRQLGTLGQAAGFGSQDLSRLMSGGQALAGIDMNRLGLMGQLQGQDTATRLGAASDLNQYGLNQGQQGLGALSALPGLRDYGQSGARDLMGLGQLQEGQASAELQDLMNRWNFSQQAPWDQLGRYSGIVGGMGNLGGTTTATGPKAPSGGLMGALGGAAGGAGIASALSLAGPWGWGLAGLGGLMGAFG